MQNKASSNDNSCDGFGGGYLPPILRTRRTSAKAPQPFIFRENMTVVIQPHVITEDERMGVQVGELVRVPHDIKVELSSCDVSHIQIRRQDALARKVGTGEHLPKGIDNATTTTRKDCLWLITKW